MRDRPGAKSMGKPESIASIVARQLADLGIARKVKQASVEHLWPELVGPEIAAHTRVQKVDLGRLFVAVDSPVWRQELLFHRTEFVSKLNGILGEPVISDIMFTGP